MNHRQLSSLEKGLLCIIFTAIGFTIMSEILSSSSTSSFRIRENAVETAIARLKTLGINFLAIDFDQTILDCHTGGRWQGTLDELRGHVRSEFRQLLTACAQYDDMHMAIVTFSPQVVLVRGVLESILGPDQANRIPIRGGDRSWQYNGVGSQDGKQPHMASAVEELEHSSEVRITKNTTVLIDDDKRNIQHALNDGVRAILFNPSKPHHLFQELARLV